MSNVMDADSAYVILVNSDNSMTVTKKQRIMQRSKMVDSLWFLVNPIYNGYDLTKFTVCLEYVLPISREYKTEFLDLSQDMYNGYLKYQLPIDTNLTLEAGDIELQITFILSDLDEGGNSIQRVRKVSGVSITIVPINAWSNIIPDSALSALDQRIIMVDAQIRALNEASEYLCQSKADNISYNKATNELQLMSEGSLIGDKVVLKSVDMDPDGMVVVDFSNNTTNPDGGNSTNDNDVVEF